jgi:Fe-S cluster biogenesis protein NfuA
LFLKEIMSTDPSFQKHIQRIGEIVEQLETSADPHSRSVAKELLESVMALHGSAVERILQIVSESGEAGQDLIRKLGRDDLVSSLLLLYGLHPEDLHGRVIRALEKLRAHLASHAASAELLSVTEDGAVKVRLHMKSNGCGTSAASLKSTLEAGLQNAAPDATSIVIEETGATMQAGFVSLAQLQNGPSVAAFSLAPTPRSGD